MSGTWRKETFAKTTYLEPRSYSKNLAIYHLGIKMHLLDHERFLPLSSLFFLIEQRAPNNPSLQSPEVDMIELEHVVCAPA